MHLLKNLNISQIQSNDTFNLRATKAKVHLENELFDRKKRFVANHCLEAVPFAELDVNF